MNRKGGWVISLIYRSRAFCLLCWVRADWLVIKPGAGKRMMEGCTEAHCVNILMLRFWKKTTTAKDWVVHCRLCGGERADIGEQQSFTDFNV